MRVIYIHQYFNTPSASSSIRSYEMARRIAARGHDVHIVTSSREGHPELSERIENFTVHWLPVRYSQFMSNAERIRAFFLFAYRATKKARALRGDIVFATSTPLTVALPGIAATLFSSRPLVFEVRDLWPDAPIAMGAIKSKVAQKLALFLEKFTYNHSSHIVALSPDMRDVILAKGVDHAKVSVVPNASDNDLFINQEDAARRFRSERSWLGDRKLVLYCGTLGRVNDVSYIARLADATRAIDPSIRFLVVGQGSDEDRVRKTAQLLGVYEENFFMSKPVPKTEVPTIFSAADLSMSTVAPVPLLAANSANKVFDTFASGTPLAINHRGWLAKLLNEEQAGLVLSPTNTEAAAETLVNFLYSPEEMQNASVNAKRLAKERFDRQLLAEQLTEILEQTYTQKSTDHAQSGKDLR